MRINRTILYYVHWLRLLYPYFFCLPLKGTFWNCFLNVAYIEQMFLKLVDSRKSSCTPDKNIETVTYCKRIGLVHVKEKQSERSGHLSQIN